MDYEKKYKNALEWARKVMQGKVGFVLDEVLEKFPELKDSEDERIRKAIIKLVDEHSDGTMEMLAWLEKQGEQKSAWSENDERLFISALWHVKNSCGNGGKNSGEFEVYNWLKSLKERVQPQQEWTMQDEEELQIALDTLVKAGQHSSAKWLKNVCLVPQSHWKPSDEQMKHLKTISVGWHPDSKDCQVLNSLYNDLKKLKEE